MGINNGETVACHMYRLALMAMILTPIAEEKRDANKCIQLALVHDLAESIVGDITPECGVSKEEKHHREHVRPRSILSASNLIACDACLGGHFKDHWDNGR